MINILTTQIKQVAGDRYITFTADEDVFAILSIQWGAMRAAEIDLLVRVEDGYIIIEQDTGLTPFVDRLIAAGIPRDQIVLAYADETIEAEIYAD